MIRVLRSFLVLLAVAFIYPLVAAADYERALESYLKEDYVQAATRFDRLIAQSPSHPKIRQAIYYSAICRLKLDQPKPAAERLTLLLSNSPSDTPPSGLSSAVLRLALGTACQMLGDETSALSHFELSWLSAANAFERAASREKIRELRSRSDRTISPPTAERVSASDLPVSRRFVPAPGWAVQVVSAPDMAQAESVRAHLQRAGWPVFQETAAVNGVTYYRIRVGPYPAESDAMTARSRLRSDMGIEGWVTRK